MNYVNLPNLSLIATNHFDLRVQAARAISSLEVQAARGIDVTPSAKQLATFFSACEDACSVLVKPVAAK